VQPQYSTAADPTLAPLPRRSNFMAAAQARLATTASSCRRRARAAATCLAGMQVYLLYLNDLILCRLNTPSLQQHQQPPGETDDSRFPARVPSTSRLSTSGGVTSTPLGPNRLTLRTPPMSGRIQPPADSLLSLQQTSTWASTYEATHIKIFFFNLFYTKN